MDGKSNIEREREQTREINMEEVEGRRETREEEYARRNKNGGKYRKKRKRKKRKEGKRNGGDEDKERLGKRGGENDPKTQWSSMPPRKIGLWSPLTISKLRATLPTYPA